MELHDKSMCVHCACLILEQEDIGKKFDIWLNLGLSKIRYDDLFWSTANQSKTHLRSSCYGGYLSISHVIDHVTRYKFECSHWRDYTLQDWLSNLNAVISTNENNWIYYRSHVLQPGLYLNIMDDNHLWQLICSYGYT